MLGGVPLGVGEGVGVGSNPPLGVGVGSIGPHPYKLPC